MQHFRPQPYLHRPRDDNDHPEHQQGHQRPELPFVCTQQGARAEGEQEEQRGEMHFKRHELPREHIRNETEERQHKEEGIWEQIVKR